MATIIPIFKAEDPNFFVDYRHISMLSNFSKFFEKVICNRSVEFAEKKTIYFTAVSLDFAKITQHRTH